LINRTTPIKMARPTEESEANGASEVHPQNILPMGNQQDIVGDASDGDGAERPLREKLKKTSIASLAQYTNSRTNPTLHSDELPSTQENHGEQADLGSDAATAARGRPARKRSFDDLQKEDTQSTVAASQLGGTAEKGSHHKRMRSRDTSGSEELVANGQARTEPLEYHDEEDGDEEEEEGEGEGEGEEGEGEEEESDIDARRSPGGPGVLVEPPAMKESTPPPTNPTADSNSVLSPKKKRSRDQFDKDHNPQDEGSDDSENSIIRSGSEPAENDDQLAQTTSRTATGEPEKKRPRDEELKSEINTTVQEVRGAGDLLNWPGLFAFNSAY
jgi:Ran-binding protein 3